MNYWLDILNSHLIPKRAAKAGLGACGLGIFEEASDGPLKILLLKALVGEFIVVVHTISYS